jgi:16S rRNA (guanine1516-N2)-methyltransferase
MNTPTELTARVVVVADPDSDPMLRLAARQLAAELGLPLAELSDAPADIELRVQGDGLSLAWVGADPAAPGDRLSPVRVELSDIDGTSGRGRSLRQPIARAVGLVRGDPWRPHVFDATAGFGEDAFLLAQLGCRVTACERSPVMAALLGDAVRRAGRLRGDAADRLQVCLSDSAARLADPFMEPDVVYLDPMFPPRRKAARQRKNLWMLHQLVGADADADELLQLALQRARARVVVKRPLHAQPLADRPPAAAHKGKAHRFDVYPTR